MKTITYILTAALCFLSFFASAQVSYHLKYKIDIIKVKKGKATVEPDGTMEISSAKDFATIQYNELATPTKYTQYYNMDAKVHVAYAADGIRYGLEHIDTLFKTPLGLKQLPADTANGTMCNVYQNAAPILLYGREVSITIWVNKKEKADPRINNVIMNASAWAYAWHSKTNIDGRIEKVELKYVSGSSASITAYTLTSASDQPDSTDPKASPWLDAANKPALECYTRRTGPSGKVIYTYVDTEISEGLENYESRMRALHRKVSGRDPGIFECLHVR